MKQEDKWREIIENMLKLIFHLQPSEKFLYSPKDFKDIYNSSSILNNRLCCRNANELSWQPNIILNCIQDNIDAQKYAHIDYS